MLRTRIILLVGAALLVLLIFYFPQVVVDNNPDEITDAEENRSVSEADSLSAPGTAVNAHAPKQSEKTDQAIENLKEKLSTSENIEKSVIFADSLAQLYVSINKYDSAAKFVEIIAENVPALEHRVRAGDMYYEAFTYAMEADKRSYMAKKAREYFEQVLKEAPKRLDIKNKLAMTYLSTSDPMKGIMMLREILKEDPENEKAMFNLGALSMQSNQYDKAVERFSRLVELYPENTQAHYFLGVSYMETGKKEKAKEQFEIVKKLDNDPQVQAAVDAYLEEIK